MGVHNPFRLARRPGRVHQQGVLRCIKRLERPLRLQHVVGDDRHVWRCVLRDKRLLAIMHKRKTRTAVIERKGNRVCACGKVDHGRTVAPVEGGIERENPILPIGMNNRNAFPGLDTQPRQPSGACAGGIAECGPSQRAACLRKDKGDRIRFSARVEPIPNGPLRGAGPRQFHLPASSQ